MAGLLDRLLREESVASGSDAWYRVARTRPRLSPHAQLIRQRFGRDVVTVVEDPAGGQFARLGEGAALFAGLLDGRRTAAEALEACEAQMGDDAPTRRECVEALARLRYAGLLWGEVPILADATRDREREQGRTRRLRRWGGGIAPVVPLINPERWLEAVAPLLRGIYSWWGLGAWVVLVATALWHVVAERGRLADGFNGFLDPANVALLAVLFVLLRIVHEFGHASACKAMGGRCTEVGVILMAWVLPLPYCDASSAWRFPAIWRRVLVSGAGVLAETVPAAVAAIVWAHSEPGTVRALAFNAMVLSGFTTVVFNLNPLLRYDGYYILSDLTGTPNLAQRGVEVWKHLVQRVGFGAVRARPPAVRSAGEFWFLLVYGGLSWPYRMIVLGFLCVMLIEHPRWMGLGLLLAGALAAVSLVWPMLKGLGFLAASPVLIGRRARAAGVVVGFVLAVWVLVGILPMPSSAYATGQIEAATLRGARAGADGFVARVLVASGARVEAGQALIELENPDATLRLERAEAAVARAEAELAAASVGPAGSRRQYELALEQERVVLADARRSVEALVVRAEVAGVVVPPTGIGPAIEDLAGRFVRRGELLATVAGVDRLVVRALLDDAEHARVFAMGGYEAVRAWARVRGRAGEVVPMRVTRVGVMGVTDVGREALTTAAGGEVALDPTATRPTAMVPQFEVELEAAESALSARWQPGLRARVKLAAPPEPWARAWGRSLSRWWMGVGA